MWINLRKGRWFRWRRFEWEASLWVLLFLKEKEETSFSENEMNVSRNEVVSWLTSLVSCDETSLLQGEWCWIPDLIAVPAVKDQTSRRTSSQNFFFQWLNSLLSLSFFLRDLSFSFISHHVPVASSAIDYLWLLLLSCCCWFICSWLCSCFWYVSWRTKGLSKLSCKSVITGILFCLFSVSFRVFLGFMPTSRVTTRTIVVKCFAVQECSTCCSTSCNAIYAHDTDNRSTITSPFKVHWISFRWQQLLTLQSFFVIERNTVMTWHEHRVQLVIVGITNWKKVKWGLHRKS